MKPRRKKQNQLDSFNHIICGSIQARDSGYSFRVESNGIISRVLKLWRRMVRKISASKSTYTVYFQNNGSQNSNQQRANQLEDKYSVDLSTSACSPSVPIIDTAHSTRIEINYKPQQQQQCSPSNSSGVCICTCGRVGNDGVNLEKIISERIGSPPDNFRTNKILPVRQIIPLALSEEEDHIERPMDAFELWSIGQRRNLARENPDLSGGQINQILAIKWKNLNHQNTILPINEASKRSSHSQKQEHSPFINPMQEINLVERENHVLEELLFYHSISSNTNIQSASISFYQIEKTQFHFLDQ